MIQVKDLKKEFTVKNNIFKSDYKTLYAVNGVSFKIGHNETLGLVGESGSGKSTTGRLILRLLKPSSGQVFLEGRDISTISNRKFRKLRKDLQMLFQNPYSSLDYKMTIEDILIQPLQIHKIVKPTEYRAEVERLLELVGLSKKDRKKLPHEFSGGQRQRIIIARALSTKPKFIVCDEPVSQLDLSIQSQILNLLKDFQKEFGLSYLFIAHDLSVIRHVSHKVAVMYLGKIVEYGEEDELFKSPLHPYTEALMSASPIANPDIERNRIQLKGEIPSAMEIPNGCSFHTRCPKKMEICQVEEPILQELDNGRQVSCHLVDLEAE